MNRNHTTALFSERQYISRWWLLTLLPSVLIATAVVLFVEKDENPFEGLLVLFVVESLVACLLLFMYLETEYSETEIRYRFPPFLWKWRSIPMTSVAKMYVRKYDPLWEYGGWGIKGTKKNRVYNLKGDIGLQLELTDGRKVLFGTSTDGKELETIVKDFVAHQEVSAL